MLNQYRRNFLGHAIAEFAPALWLLFIMFTAPIAMFGSWGIRYVLFINAVNSAAASGAQCKSFITDISSSDISATNTATQIIQNAVSANPGFTTQQINTYIVIRPLNGSTTTKQNTPLAQPANVGLNAYNFEVSVTAQLQPLWTNSANTFGNVPGLTGPLVTTVRADSFFESTQGLTQ